MKRIYLLSIILCLKCSLLEAQNLPVQYPGLHGYLASYSANPPAEYNLGFGFYSAVWSLTPEPVAGFQIGLPGTWLIPDNTDNTTEPLCPIGTYARDNWPERGPTYEDVFQTIEGGLGYWVGNRYHYGPPKYSMNSTPNCYTQQVASPGWPFFGSASPLADDELAIAQLSNRLVIPPDGLPFEGEPNGAFLGYSYLCLPLTDAKISPHIIGNNNWTLFLNAQNFKGPLAFFVPETWTKVSIGQEFGEGRGLDSKPSRLGGSGGTMEINSVPFFSEDISGTTYTKIPELQFPVDENDETVLVRDLAYYSGDAIYNDVLEWKNGNTTIPSGTFNTNGVHIPNMFTSSVNYSQNEETIEGINEMVQPTIFSDQSFGLIWDDPGNEPMAKFPRYFRDDGATRTAITEEEVPIGSQLLNATFASPNTDQFVYQAEITGAWDNPASGPHNVALLDGSMLTYYWYKFIDQPVFRQYTWSEQERNELQSLVEQMHQNWTLEQEYMHPILEGELVSFDNSLIVTPPVGLEYGYVPIVTRQSSVENMDCGIFNVTMQTDTLSLQDNTLQAALTIDGLPDTHAVNWSNGTYGNSTVLQENTYHAMVTYNNCRFYHYSPPFATAATGVNPTSFYANWDGVPGAMGYEITVAEDEDFNEVINGLDNISLANINQVEIPIQIGITEYYYRLKTLGFEGEVSSASNTIYVNIDDPGCNIDAQVVVNNVSSNTTNDGSASITVVGAIDPYSIVWSSGETLTEIDNLPIGSYTVTVTDFGGCNKTELFEIGLPIGSNSLGNRVWYDSNHNGIDDFGEPGIPDVNVALWKDNNNDGNPELWQGFVTTDSDGYYMFTDLTPGIYQLFVWEIGNWGQGESLFGMKNTIGSYNPNNDIDMDDNGQLASEIQSLSDQNIISKPIVLTETGEPLLDGDREDPNFDYDPSGNMTIDFGFYSVDEDCPVINMVISGSDYVCENASDGYINSHVASGTPPYTYEWSNENTNADLINQPAGEYMLTVTDANGCLGSETYTIQSSSSSDTLFSLLACEAYTWNTNGQTYTISGQYTEVLTNSMGCDSNVVLDLTVISVPEPNIIQNGNILACTNFASSYQWLDCEANYASIEGETSMVFTATQNGSYALEITFNECSDTSECFIVNTVGIQDGIVKERITIYPNPTSSSFIILSENIINSKFKIIDEQGRAVSEGFMHGKKQAIDISKLSTGVYSVVFAQQDLPLLSVVKD